MIITIHQPNFLPWLGFFNKVRSSDLLIIGDHIQFERRGFQNRNRIKTDQGSKWLTIPIIREYPQAINKVKIHEEPRNGLTWRDLHLRTLRTYYGKAPYYEKYIGIFENIYMEKINLLAENNLKFLSAIFDILGLDIKMKKASEMTTANTRTEEIIEICKTLGADSYLSGMGGLRYMECGLFEKNGIKLLFNNYSHPVYNQQFMKIGFLPNLSIIDLIFNAGPDSLEIIKSGFKGFEMTPISQ